MAGITPILCYLEGHSTEPFVLNISSRRPVSHLKDQIVIKIQKDFPKVATDHLEFWSVSTPFIPRSEISLDKISDKSELRNHAATIHSVLRSDRVTDIRVALKESLSEVGHFKRIRSSSSLEDAIRRAGHIEKASEEGGVSLRALALNERAEVLYHLGSRPSFLDPYTSLFKTARILKKKFGPDGKFPENNTISVPMGSPAFPIIDENRLYVRESYRRLYDRLLTDLKDDIRIGTINQFVLTGTSGIGISAFLVYFVIRLLAECDENSPPIIIFHTKDSTCYAFGGTNVMSAGKIDDFRSLLYCRETWYLVDDAPHFKLTNGKSVIVASQDNLRADSTSYKDLHKTVPIVQHMAPWSFSELDQARKILFSNVSREIMSELYSKLGGIPRYALYAPSICLLRNPRDIKHAKNRASERLEQAIVQVRDPTEYLQYAVLDNSYQHFGCHLFHSWPDMNNGWDVYVTRLEWASDYVLSQFHKLMRTENWSNILEGLASQYSFRGIRKGLMFDLYVYHILQQGGYTFKIEKLDEEAEHQELNIPHNSKVKYIQNLNDLCTELSAKKLGQNAAIPSNPDFLAPDFFLMPTEILRPDKAMARSIKQNTIVKIIQKVPGCQDDRVRFRLLFVLPTDFYDDKKVRSCLMDNENVSSEVPLFMQGHVDQFVLKIDIKSAAKGGSPGSGGIPYKEHKKGRKQEQ
ncbi:hypothetical protein BGX27_006425 [Mortierella sp. AM989]|nr:hypothetical protein BGX27_006425 [Mortierella sp. AM989]